MVLGTLVVALWGCDGDRPELDPTTGLLGQGLSWPFPSAHLVEDGHLAIPSSELALPEGSTPLPTERLAWRTGFSPVQTAAVQLEGVDAAALPGADQVGTPGSVRLVDLDTGTELPMFAEGFHPYSVNVVADRAMDLEDAILVAVVNGEIRQMARCDASGQATFDLDLVADDEVVLRAHSEIEFALDAREVAVVAPPCPADLDGSGAVDIDDLLAVVGGWNSSQGDITGDGTTDIADVLAVLDGFGECP